jgi:hypothetical protein
MMPTYTFHNEETQEEFTTIMSLSEREEFLKNNPHIKQCLATPAFADPVRMGVRKIDRSFNDVLLKAKSAHKHSTIDTL